MKTFTVTFCGSRFNKLIAQPNDEVSQWIQERRNTNPDPAYRLPQDEEFLQFTSSKQLSSIVKYNVPTKCLVKLTNYDFLDEKKNEQIKGAYLQLIAVL